MTNTEMLLAEQGTELGAAIVIAIILIVANAVTLVARHQKRRRKPTPPEPYTPRHSAQAPYDWETEGL